MIKVPNIAQPLPTLDTSSTVNDSNDLILPDVGPTPPAEDPSPLDLPDKQSNLQDLYNSVSKQDPARAGEVVNLSRKLNEPEAFIEKNIPEAKRVVSAPDQSMFQQIESQYPGTTKFLSNPANMAATHDDLDNLSFHEKIINGVKDAWNFESNALMAGGLAEEKSFLRYGQLMGRQTADLNPLRPGTGTAMLAGIRETDANKRIEQIDEYLHGLEKSKPQDSLFKKGLYGATEFLPQILGGAASGIKYALPTGLLSSWASPLVQAPLTAAAFATGEVEYNFQLMAGMSYDSLLKVKDVNGNPLPDDSMKVASLAMGAAGVGLSFVKLGALVDTIPGGKEFLGKFSSTVGEKVLSDPKSYAAALKSFTTSYATAVAHGTGAMVGLTAIDIAGKEAAKAASGQQFEPVTGTQMLGELGQAAESGALTFGVLGFPGSAAGFAHEAAQVRKANQAKEFYTALGDTATASKLRERMPDDHKQFISEITKDSPVEHIYIPEQALTEYFQSKNIDPEKAVSELGVGASYSEARGTGGDVKIPLSTWTDKIIGTEHYQGLADDIKFNQDDLTVRQVETRRAEIKQQMADMQKEAESIPASESSQKVYDERYQQLVDSGRSEAEAKQGAKLHEAMFKTLAERTGADPYELAQRFRLEVQKNAEAAGISGPGQYNQTGLTPLGFYSALESEVGKMDFKSMPAKDLANRIKNLGGIKADELEHTGVIKWLEAQDGKVTKEEVSAYLKDNTVNIEQVVKSKDFKENSDSDLHSETDWKEPERDHSNDYYDIQNELEYYSSDDYWDNDKIQELRDELAPDFTDEDGNIDTENLDREIESEKEVRSQKYAEESVESDDYSGANYYVHDRNTGWSLSGSDEHGWYNGDTGHEFGYDLEEAKVQLVRHMIAAGVLDGKVSDYIHPKDITWRDGSAAVYANDGAVTRKAKKIIETDRARLEKQVADESYEGEYDGKTAEEKQAMIDKDVLRIARGEARATYNDHTNKKNIVEFKIEHSLLDGKIVGNDVIGYKLEVGGGKSAGGGARTVPDVYPLESKKIEEAKLEAIKVLQDNDLVKKDSVNSDGTTNVNEPTGKTKWHKYMVPNGENYREVLLTLPKAGPEKFQYDTHFNEKNILAHVRLSDRVDDKGRKTLYLEELQSDWHQQGRERGYKGDNGLSPEEKSKQEKDLLEKINFNTEEINKEESNIREFKKQKIDEFKATLPKKIKISDFKSSKEFDGHGGKSTRYTDFLGSDALDIELDVMNDTGDITVFAHGRRKFSGGKKTMPEALATIKQMVEGQIDFGNIEKTFSESDKQEFNKLSERKQKISDENEILRSQKLSVNEANAVPDAPYKNTEAWAGLAMKRMIRMAVEQGYDAVAWSPASVHVDRWGTDNVSWVKRDVKLGVSHNPVQKQWTVVKRDQISGKPVEGGIFKYDDVNVPSELAKHAAEEFAKEYSKPHWLVGSAEQRGGNADGTNIEELARARGALLERNGEKVTNKEELKKVVAETLGRERNDRSLESLTDSIWKQMQEKDSGVKAPRKEGMEFFYDNVLPKKVVTPILKKLDPNAKIEVAKFDIGKDLSAERKYEGPEFTANQIEEELKNEFASARLRNQLNEVLHAVKEEGQSFSEAMTMHGSEDLARRMGGKLADAKNQELPSLTIPLTDAVKEKAAAGQTLFQPGEGDSPLGRIKIGDEKSVIEFFKDANRSTFLHESGHYFLEVMKHLSSDENAPAQIKEDFQTIRDYLGVKEGEGFATEHHENFARSFEAYLMEGHAPSNALKQAFSRFKKWLVEVYKTVRSLDVNLSPEIRDVMDRMLATDEEIARAQKTVGVEEINQAFPDSIKKRMDTLRSEAREQAESTLLRQQMKEITDEHKKFLDSEKVKFTDIAEREVMLLPIFQAIKDLEGYKRGSKKMAEQFLSGKIKDADASEIIAVAEVHGYQNAYEFAKEIVDAKTNNRFESEVKTRVDAAMEKHAALKDTDQIKLKALEVIHNDKMTEFIALEHQALSELIKSADIRAEISGRKKAEARVDAILTKQEAKSILSEKPIKEAGNFRVYVTAERKAAVNSAKAAQEKDFESAAKYKKQQMLNNALARESMGIRTEAQKILKYLSKPEDRGRDMMNMPYGFIRQVDQLLSKFGLAETKKEDTQTLQKIAQDMTEKGQDPADIANATGYMLDRTGKWVQEDLSDFVSRVNDNYYGLHISDFIINNAGKDSKDLTMQDLRELKTAVKAISETGRKFNRFLSDFIKIDIDAAAAETRASIEKNVGTPYAENKGIGSKFKGKLGEKLESILNLPDTIIPSLVNILTASDHLDGGNPDGPMKKYVYRVMKKAEDGKLARYTKMRTDVNDLLGAYFTPKELREYKNQKEFIEPLNRYMTREEVLSLALNWGNEGNRDRIRKGYNLDDSQVMNILNRLNKKEFDFVQAVWDHLDSYWPDVAALEMKVNGLEPGRVEPSEVNTQHGNYRGGYYPIAYDFEKSSDAYRTEEQKNALYKQYSTSSAHTDTGHTESRVSSVSRPVRLSLDVFFNHLENLVHDLEYRPAVIDVNRFLKQNDVKTAIENAIGIGGYRTYTDWLKSIASDQGETLNIGEKAFRWFRFNTTFATLAYKVFALPMDLTGNTINGIWEVGPSKMISATMDFALNGGQTKEFVQSKSERMKSRAQLRDRDIMDISRKWTGNESAFKKFAFYFQHIADETASYPLWSEVYKNAVSEHGEQTAIHLADEAVTRTLGSGSMLDQVGVQRGSESKKILGMYYSWMSMMFNRAWSSGKMAGLEYNKGNTTGALAIMAKAAFFAWGLQAANENFWRELMHNNPNTDDENARIKRIAGRTLQQPFGYVWLVRDISGFAIDTALGMKGANIRLSPLEQAAETVIKPFGNLANIAFADSSHDNSKVAEESARSAAYLFGYPQTLNNMAFNFLDYNQTSGEFTWRDLLARRTKH